MNDSSDLLYSDGQKSMLAWVFGWNCIALEFQIARSMLVWGNNLKSNNYNLIFLTSLLDPTPADFIFLHISAARLQPLTHQLVCLCSPF